MDAKKIKTAQKKLTNELKKYDSKKFKVMFYVMDTRVSQMATLSTFTQQRST